MKSLLFFVYVFILPVVTIAGNCHEDVFKDSALERAFSYDLNDISQAEFRYRAGVNNRIPEGGAAISFGSGGDVLSPLLTFFRQEQVHLVDILTSWGAGPGEVILEVTRRLEHLAVDHKVTIVDRGFTAFIPIEKMAVPPGWEQWRSTDDRARVHFALDPVFWQKWGYPNLENADSRYLLPLILDLYVQDGPNRLPKRVYLHPLDYQDSRHLDLLLDRIDVPLRGIFITGTSPPDGISKVLDRMDSQGMFVLELFKRYESILDLLANRGSFEEFKAHSNDYKGDEVRFIHFQKN